MLFLPLPWLSVSQRFNGSRLLLFSRRSLLKADFVVSVPRRSAKEVPGWENVGGQGRDGHRGRRVPFSCASTSKLLTFTQRALSRHPASSITSPSELLVVTQRALLFTLTERGLCWACVKPMAGGV
jgi:hypothetical protein